MAAADIDIVADGDGVLDQDEHAVDDVADELLRAEPDRDADNAGAGQKRRDVDAELRQRDGCRPW